MALPLAVIAARAGWMAAGAAVTLIAGSKLGKEAVKMFKDGTKEMGELHKKDAAASMKQRRYNNDIASKRQMVKDIREGRQR